MLIFLFSLICGVLLILMSLYIYFSVGCFKYVMRCVFMLNVLISCSCWRSEYNIFSWMLFDVVMDIVFKLFVIFVFSKCLMLCKNVCECLLRYDKLLLLSRIFTAAYFSSRSVNATV